MRYVLIIAGMVLFLGCATKYVPMDTSNLVTKTELKKALDGCSRVVMSISDDIDMGDVLTEIEQHRDECLHACDSK